MKENLNIDAIRQLLDRSASQIDQTTLSRLHEVRSQALTRVPTHVQSPVLAWIDTHFRYFMPAKRHAIATWIAVVLLIAALLGGIDIYWQQSYDKNAAVDIAILTDDLPINYYVD
jgi:hypothetical protein